MALGGKTVQYTLAVDLETGQLTAEASNVSKQIQQIQKTTKGADGGMLEFARSIKQLKNEMSLLFLGSFGGYALAIGALGDAISFVTSTLKGFMSGVRFDEKALTDLNEYVTGLENAGKAQSYLIDLKIKDLEAQIKINEAQNATASVGSTIFTGNIYTAIAAFGAWIGMKKEENKVIDENTKKNRDQYKLLDDLQKLKSDALSKEFANRPIIGAAPTSIPGIERDNPAKQFENLNLAIGVTMPNLMAVTQAEEDMRAEMIRYGATSQEELAAIKKELGTMLDSGFMTFINGMVDGFAAIGEAIVNGTSGLKGFGAAFLKTISQIAIQFGTFIMLTGLAKNALPEIFGLSGAAAVAAGAALVVFGGALGAIAGKIGGSSGRGASSERDQRFRDSNFNSSGGNAGTTIINNINFANTIGLTRDAMKEVGEVISAELFKQNKLGRIQTVG